ncbi:MAG: flagellar hook protein FlgE [Armatimonadota bacterium]|nr:flagellar hook protein FlgE [bacterium]
MIQAMFSGVSGMKAFKSALDVVGNNIANANTTAYKSQGVTFKEALSQTINSASAPSASRGGTNPSQIGLGVSIGSITTKSAQGSLTYTGNDTDMAIDGDGYFVLGGGEGISYTRDGGFALDSNYNLVSSSSGKYALGWQADATTGVLDTSSAITSSSKIEIPVGKMSLAEATDTAELAGNLDASSATGDDYTVSFDIYDSLGTTHTLDVTFTKLAVDAAATPPIGPSTWRYDVMCDDVSTTVPVATGNITFSSTGYSNLASIPLSLTFATNNGSVTPLVASIDTSTLSQLDGDNTVALSSVDGMSYGTLESYTIDASGIITGTFTNGATRTIAQVAMASFDNPSGLTKEGSNLYSESPNSGRALISTAGSGSLGTITSGYLEASNVDLAAEFASMIVAQRGFQANSRIITISDQVLEELVNLKR